MGREALYSQAGHSRNSHVILPTTQRNRPTVDFCRPATRSGHASKNVAAGLTGWFCADDSTAPIPGRHATVGAHRVAAQSEPQTGQRVVSVSQILPSNFLVPDSYDGLFPPLPSPTSAGGAGDLRVPSGGTHELYGGSSRRSIDDTRPFSSSVVSSPAQPSTTMDTPGMVRASAESAGGEAQGGGDAQPHMHQVFSALALKVAKAERQRDEMLTDRSSRSEGDVAFRGGTDILPQVRAVAVCCAVLSIPWLRVCLRASRSVFLRGLRGVTVSISPATSLVRTTTRTAFPSCRWPEASGTMCTPPSAQPAEKHHSSLLSAFGVADYPRW